MKEPDGDSVKIDVEKDSKPYKREKPIFKKTKMHYSKNILEDTDSSALIELSTKNSPNKIKSIMIKAELI